MLPVRTCLPQDSVDELLAEGSTCAAYIKELIAVQTQDDEQHSGVAHPSQVQLYVNGFCISATTQIPVEKLDQVFFEVQRNDWQDIVNDWKDECNHVDAQHLEFLTRTLIQMSRLPELDSCDSPSAEFGEIVQLLDSCLRRPRRN
eukprot:TRINITY_DN27328_c0_g1_i1.p1 TRINITY_DN27328_c0_g1~~TRINITY_DN27328_c0_g1_i1.p1  ORF type:complete len:145 (+),score=28.87 TRINITY_DN27328_c0_g1_i1:105-539(+)